MNHCLSTDVTLQFIVEEAGAAADDVVGCSART